MELRLPIKLKNPLSSGKESVLGYDWQPVDVLTTKVLAEEVLLD